MYFLHKPLSYQFQRIHYKNHSDTPTNTPQEIRVFYALIHLECWQRNDLLLLKGSLAPTREHWPSTHAPLREAFQRTAQTPKVTLEP